MLIVMIVIVASMVDGAAAAGMGWLGSTTRPSEDFLGLGEGLAGSIWEFPKITATLGLFGALSLRIFWEDRPWVV